VNSTSPIEITSYNPNWVCLFETEKHLIQHTIGQHVSHIEHIGSTAVEGLAAKPVIDILVGVRSLADAPIFLPPLVSLGYEYVPEHETVFPERRYLHKLVNGQHTHHLHIVEPSSRFFHVQLLFRDYLRAHPETAREYAALKFKLASTHRLDREAYTDGKSVFITAVLQKAETDLIGNRDYTQLTA
jgi:GrpB-like predicted nucleotidyltransferase (UPF0157 family)